MNIETDRQILKLYEQGLTQKAIAKQVVQGKQSTVFNRLKYYRENKVLQGHTVAWKTFELKPHTRKPTRKNITTGNTPVISTDQDITAGNMTPQSWQSLQEVLSWWQEQKARQPIQPAGQTKTASFKIDTAVLEALKRYALERRLTLSGCLTQAIELLLARKD